MTILLGKTVSLRQEQAARWMAVPSGYVRSSHTPPASTFCFVFLFLMCLCWDLSGIWSISTFVCRLLCGLSESGTPFLFCKNYKRVRTSLILQSTAQLRFFGRRTYSCLEWEGGMPRCLLIETSSQTCTVVAMCSISVLRGCLLCICSFHVSLNILFGYWARLWQPAALGCSTTCFFSGHAGLSWSWLWASAGGLSEWHLSGFLKLRRSWRNTASLLPWNWASVSFKCVPGNEHAQRTGKSLSSDREEMIVVLHL